ncbi:MULTISPECIES: acetyl-CoA carboxylase biotin carboxyl carrier protein [Prochlorococcus]|uniref:acetyl-CoA carboxylase biotin carboxyl carrier protein n=1 Tax=Prochlorococcus TaxID=1218 RepID=UPI0007BB9C23|nr:MULTISPECIES: acetyl-CoA carboxylase biotin carboxyl carrier protein [Prochlorococcus]KZR64850.1 Biotin carboxyl carrier protein of acetyl-CoA carboxylase [Prochlorococcus marinus str. MIT 1312]KZR79415.1 Biotin carboxyl carrier protein of acetyl-CoA carboxylase [Prochlorococcus marinus str. MIT 1327]NMO84380.1 acetyl-CoA carboxylase biotin carboxyl carrier protein [Prochlorococcus sp. P1344]NMP07335.1 acetyl-CoA carboxylase biotin carboxyl carrier protein [Prochlorococcus sp. P1361]NMP1467
MAMQLDHDQLHQLLAALAESDIQEFRLEGDDFRLEVRRNIPAPAVVAPVMPLSSTVEMPLPAPEPRVEMVGPGTPPPAVPGSRTDFLEVTAPMVGTFYRAPGPGESPFVEVGSRIGVGQIVCILEAMKLMNELESEVSGEVVEILVDNGTPVEFGQVLMRVKPG